MALLDDVELSLPQILLVVVVIVGLLTLLVAGSTSSQAFGTFNSAWDGSSGVRSAAADTGVDVEVVTETTPYETAGPETVAIVLAPTEPYNATDISRLRSFLERGGTLIVAEDIGQGGNRVLSRLGGEVRFDGRVVADQRHHGPTTDMPLATNVTQSQYTAGVDSVMLNRGTVLTNTSNATVLVSTSEFAYLDRNGNDELDEDETIQTYPVAAVESVGDGRIITVSDPSVFINAMQSRADNAVFLRALVGGSNEVLLDYSHAGEQPPVRAALLWLRRTPLALVSIGVVGLAVVARATRTRDRESP